LLFATGPAWFTAYGVAVVRDTLIGLIAILAIGFLIHTVRFYAVMGTGALFVVPVAVVKTLVGGHIAGKPFRAVVVRLTLRSPVPGIRTAVRFRVGRLKSIAVIQIRRRETAVKHDGQSPDEQDIPRVSH
jgi:hypothetical protein